MNHEKLTLLLKNKYSLSWLILKATSNKWKLPFQVEATDRVVESNDGGEKDVKIVFGATGDQGK